MAPESERPPVERPSDGGARAPEDRRVPDRDRVPDGDWVESQRREANALGSGLQFGAVIAVFAFAGMKADEALGTSPWLLLTGVGLAFIGGTVSLLKRYG